MKRKTKSPDGPHSDEVDQRKRVFHRNVVGRLINFRGLVYSPVNENGVIFLFGKVAADLNMYVETIRPGYPQYQSVKEADRFSHEEQVPKRLETVGHSAKLGLSRATGLSTLPLTDWYWGYPDCVAKRYVGRGQWEEVKIEFEFRSSGFVTHRHHPEDCDAIVCWEHDWKECPKSIEVIELKSLLGQLPNNVVEEPDKVTELSEGNIEDLFKLQPQTQGLYKKLHAAIMKLHPDVWRRVAQRSITYYSPDRVFVYVNIQKQGLRLIVFTNGKNLGGVDPIEHERGGKKWGGILLSAESEINSVKRALWRSLKRMVDAVRRGENTGWWAERES